MARVDRYYRGQGKVYFAERDTTGSPKGFKFLGNCTELNLSIDTETAEHSESYTGYGVQDRYIETSQSAMLNLTLDNFIRQNLGLAMFGEPQAVTGASVSGESHIALLGGSVFLDNINLDSNNAPTVTYDISGTPTAATEGDDYTVDYAAGRIDILEGGVITDGEELQIDYTYLDQESIGAFTRNNTEKYFVFEGLNTAEDYSPVLIHCFKVRLQPFDEWALISEDFSDLSVEGAILWDTTRAEDATGGRFFQVLQPQ